MLFREASYVQLENLLRALAVASVGRYVARHKALITLARGGEVIAPWAARLVKTA